MTGVVSRRPVPDKVRAADPLTDPGYTDAFEVSTVGAGPGPARPRSPEQWARVTFENAPPVRAFLLVSWRAVLGLRLGPPRSPDHVLGWRILARAADSVTLELRSRSLTCHLVFWTGGTTLVFSTAIRYERMAGRLVWVPASFIHRRIVPRLLRHAVRRTAG